MPETDMSKLQTSTNTQLDFSVDSKQTDASQDQKETYYDIVDWSQWFGYYCAIPELHAAVNAKATWTVGKGYQADEQTTLILDAVKGWGKDTFNTIIENMIRTSIIAGDAFAEIITNDKGILINLKPLDPGVIRIVSDRKGRILRYEQRNKIKKSIQKFQPEEIFHLCRNRVADQIHGTSIIPAIENIILYRNQAMADWNRVLHRNVEPLFIFHLDTDDTTKINEVKRKYNSARKEGENLFIPKGAVVPEMVATAANASLNPLAWIDTLNDYFFQACSIPSIVLGSSKNLTEASVKIAFMAFQRNTEEDQLQIEEQFLSQLNLVIKLEFPAIIQNEMLTEKPEQQEQAQAPEVQQEQAMEPNDTKAEMEGRK